MDAWNRFRKAVQEGKERAHERREPGARVEQVQRGAEEGKPTRATENGIRNRGTNTNQTKTHPTGTSKGSETTGKNTGMSHPSSGGGAAARQQAAGKASEAVEGAVQANRPWWKTFADDVKTGKAGAKFSDGAKKMQEKFKGKGLNMGMKVDVDMFGPTYESLKKNALEAWMTLPPEVRRASPYAGTAVLAMWITKVAFVNPARRKELESRTELADVLVENKKLRQRIAELENGYRGTGYSGGGSKDPGVALAEAVAAAVQAAAAAAQAAASAAEAASNINGKTVKGTPAARQNPKSMPAGQLPPRSGQKSSSIPSLQ